MTARPVGKGRRAVAWLLDDGGAWTVPEIAAELGLTHAVVRTALCAAAWHGLVVRVGLERAPSPSGRPRVLWRGAASAARVQA